MEADLLRFYGVDLSDYYRGGLSLRRLSVLIHSLPSDSATARAEGHVPDGWDVHAFLLADIFHAWTGSAHPSRPQPSNGKGSRYAELRRALEKQRARQTEAPTNP